MNSGKLLHPMSETRLKVLELAEGRTSRDIAIELTLSRPGVWRHLNICRKLGFAKGPASGHHTGWSRTVLGDALLHAVKFLRYSARDPMGHPHTVVHPAEAQALLKLISKA